MPKTFADFVESKPSVTHYVRCAGCGFESIPVSPRNVEYDLPSWKLLGPEGHEQPFCGACAGKVKL